MTTQHNTKVSGYIDSSKSRNKKTGKSCVMWSGISTIGRICNEPCAGTI